MKDIKQKLIKLSEEDYKKFNAKLCPDTKRKMLGIRIPVLRNFAKKLVKEYEGENSLKENLDNLLKNIDDEYFEEIMLKGFVIGYSKCDINEKMPYIRKFVSKIDSWEITDTFVPTLKIKDRDLEEVFKFIKPYFKSNKEFEVRFAVIMLLDYYIIDEYVDEVIQILDKISHDGYYAKMGVSWCLAEIGIKFNDRLMKYLQGKNNLDKFTFNKTLQKMIESYRIDEGQKILLRNMKRKY